MIEKRDMLAYLSHRDWGAVHDPNVSLYMLMMQIQTSSVVTSFFLKCYTLWALSLKINKKESTRNWGLTQT